MARLRVVAALMAGPAPVIIVGGCRLVRVGGEVPGVLPLGDPHAEAGLLIGARAEGDTASD